MTGEHERGFLLWKFEIYLQVMGKNEWCAGNSGSERRQYCD